MGSVCSTRVHAEPEVVTPDGMLLKLPAFWQHYIHMQAAQEKCSLGSTALVIEDVLFHGERRGAYIAWSQRAIIDMLDWAVKHTVLAAQLRAFQTRVASVGTATLREQLNSMVLAFETCTPEQRPSDLASLCEHRLYAARSLAYTACKRATEASPHDAPAAHLALVMLARTAEFMCT